MVWLSLTGNVVYHFILNNISILTFLTVKTFSYLYNFIYVKLNKKYVFDDDRNIIIK